MKKTIKKIIKEDKGFTGADISVSIIVILISISVIATMMYKLYLSGSGIKRNVIATDYAINILETIEVTEYEKVSFNEEDTTLKTSLDKLLKTTGNYDSATNTYTANVSGYNITITIEKYSDKSEEQPKEDYIKIITVNISYNLGKKEANNSKNTETLEIRTLKTIN